MKKNKQETIKQHYVPKFYLSYFKGEKDFVYVYDSKNNRKCRPSSPRSICSPDYFYAIETGQPDEISQLVEGWLKDYEDKFAIWLKPIISKILNLKKIESSDKYILAAFISFIWIRNPRMRSFLNDTGSKMAKMLLTFDVDQLFDKFESDKKRSFSSEQKESLKQFVRDGEYDFEFNNASHLKFMCEEFGGGDSGFTNLFFAHKWKIYISPNKPFITSDSPIVEWWLPPKGFYDSPHFFKRNKYFTLTPNILIELLPPDESKKVKRETLLGDKIEKVDIFNILIAAKSINFAYSNSPEIIDALVDSKNNPGATELKYYNLFEKVWAEEDSRRKKLNDNTI